MDEEETTRLHSYLATQSLRRTPEQLIEMLETAYIDFVKGIQALPAYLFRIQVNECEWSGGELLEHVQAFFDLYGSAISIAIETGQEPEAVEEAIYPSLPGASREILLQALATSYQRLKSSVLQADPLSHLSVRWNHFELGLMHWREWLLFTRIHLLEHVRQVQDLYNKI